MSKITPEILKAIAPATLKAKRDRFIPFMNEAMPRYGITTELRVAAFLATCCFESDYFRATAEYGKGRGKRYGRTDANGRAYYGRGIIQNTWKEAYIAFTKFVKEGSIYILKPNFVEKPELLETPYWAVEAACWFWQNNKMNALADKGKFFAIQGLTNRGNATKKALDYDKRLIVYDRILHLLPDNFNLDLSVVDKGVVAEVEIKADEKADTSGKIEGAAEILGSDSAQKTDNLQTDVSQKTVEETATGTVETTVDQSSFQADTKELDAPVPSGSTTTATKVTVFGITVPPAILMVVTVVQGWITQGYIDLKAIFDMVVRFFTENTRYIAYLIIAYLTFLALEKLFKQATFMVNMIINAHPKWHDIKVIPTVAPTTTVQPKRWYEFWRSNNVEDTKILVVE